MHCRDVTPLTHAPAKVLIIPALGCYYNWISSLIINRATFELCSNITHLNHVIMPVLCHYICHVPVGVLRL